jgi:hypothetical protein
MNVATSRLTLLATFVFVFLGFFPNPAIPISGEMGVQFNQLLALVLVPLVVLRRPPMLHLLLVVALLSMIVICGFVGLISSTAMNADLAVKMFVLIMLALIVMIPVGYYAERPNLGVITLGASLAILIHALIGLYQIQSFQNSVFPLPWIYNNPSFASAAAISETYALYIQRPFGLFPEPSAMGASIGPWLTILLGVLLRGERSGSLRRLERWVTIAAIVMGTLLMFQSRSGYTGLWLATLLPLVLYYPFVRSRPGWPRIAMVFAGGLVGIVALILSWNYVNSNLNRQSVSSNDSWAARQQSILIALSVPSRDPLHFVFGLGPGQAATYLQSTPPEDLLPSWYETTQTYDIVTVWSVLGTFYMENGLIALVVIGGMLFFVIRSIRRSSARLLGACTLAAWILGVTIATSYIPLSPIWMCLALLLVWDRLFIPAVDPDVMPSLGWVAPNPVDAVGRGERTAPTWTLAT